jgi:hypothetical protein
MNLKGKGSWDNNLRVQALTYTIVFPPNTEIDRQEPLASYTRSVLGVGVSALLSF